MTQDKSKKLSYEKIMSALETFDFGRDLHFFEEVGSTFEKSAECEVSHASVILARRQTNGRGRLGRQWASADGGIYFSLILDPCRTEYDLQFYTIICALGVQRALNSYLPCYIKWPNDIVSKDGKKLCGILTKLEHGGSGNNCINVGIGINANTNSFDEELVHASSLKLILGTEVDENKVFCRVLKEIETCVDCGDSDKILRDYSDVCITLNSRVRAVYTNGAELRGVCKSIEPDGSLVILKDDGSEVVVNSGEVSVRGIYGESYV